LFTEQGIIPNSGVDNRPRALPRLNYS